MPTPSRTYQALLHDIAELYTETRASVVRMYWEIGKRIVEVEQGGAGRSAYGKQLVVRLSADLTKRFGSGFSKSNLHRMRGLYLQRKIVPPAGQLSWSHQVELLSLPTKLQQRLAGQVQRRDLSAKELRELVQREREKLEPLEAGEGKPFTPPQPLTPKRGTPGLYRVAEIAGTRCLDLGFEAYRPLTAAERGRLEDGMIVRRAEDGTLTRVADATAQDLYTYAADVLRVVDADTWWVAIHLTATDWRREKLRLRGIDCPERGTARGDAATRQVQALVRDAAAVTLTSTKPDKWDRYLCDVYVTPADGPEVFVNNRLLALGLARRYDDVVPADWEA